MNHSVLSQDVVICNDKTIEQVKEHARCLVLFLQKTAFLTEAYILDYFVEELWKNLPESWLNILFEFDIHDLEAFLNPERIMRYREPWPLSLSAYRASAFALAIPRKPIKSLSALNQFIFPTSETPISDLSALSNNPDCDLLIDELKNKAGQYKNIPEFCRRHVKPKKQHEIHRMSKLTYSVLEKFDVNHLVDIGSGQGHLSRLLALGYNYNVATVEANQCHVSGAKLFDKQALFTLNRQNRLKDEQVKEGTPNQQGDSDELKMLPHHIKESLTPSSSQNCLQTILRNAWGERSTQPVEKFAVLGLHTCGNLAETILKTYIQCPQSKILLSVGCCYMKSEANTDCKGYPLSIFVHSMNSHLSYEAKEMSCHALDMYIQRIHDNASLLKIHCYRATLEKCIIQHHPELKHLGLRGVKQAHQLPFFEYASQALKKVSISIPEETLTSPAVQDCLNRSKDVLIFYSLRLLAAPVVESLILIDRLLYLFEQGCSGCIVPIFDPYLSPRNQILISVKKDLFHDCK